ncbi:MAG TPA: divalent metal cation transporter [Pyrinomonadaceae bacterium]|nr:divalent metal cation transporter [Pyrinomonadaceae bacterium]
MKKLLEVFLSILTAMGGFVEIGELVFTVNAGAKFGYSLLWMVLLGTVGIMVYGEMAGRIAAVNEDPIFYVIRERNGYTAGLCTLLAANVVCLLTCAAEIGGLAYVLKLLVGGPYRLLLLIALIFLLLAVWFLSFQQIERVFGLLGLLMLVFVFSAVYLHPNWSEVGQSFIPNLPKVESSRDYLVYAYFCVALMSSIMLPYETYFYAAGAIEDGWNPSDVTMNRIIVIIGFALGALLAIALVMIGAQLLLPAQIEPQLPGSAVLGPALTFGKWGLILALVGMFFAFGGAAIENALSGAYNLAHFFGWSWGKFRPPKDAARFNLSWIVIFILAAAIVMTGVDPVQVVEYSIIAAVIILPLTYFPMLMVARDKEYMGAHANGWLAESLGWFYLVLITIAALGAIPLLIITHGGEG